LTAGFTAQFIHVILNRELSMYDLYIGNKNYSSWSLRAWLLMKHFDIPFCEHMVSVAGRDYNPALKPLAGNARVPCLHADGFQVWDSLAIAEYLAERHPGMWPADAKARARARSISAEMHSGFAKLRTAMPMNLKFKLKGKPATPEVQRDIERIIEIWEEARRQFAVGDGPWLFGDFSVADAMYAPIACRLHIYNVPLSPVAAAWRDALLAHPAMLEWYADALRESEAHAHYDCLADEYGGAR
jgi:glutathione S-transferase